MQNEKKQIEQTHKRYAQKAFLYEKGNFPAEVWERNSNENM